MMTVITEVQLPEGVGPDWDQAMRNRMAAAEGAEGWVAGQILIPLDALQTRIIVGVWNTRSDWEAWHSDSTFQKTRERLDELGVEDGETTWHEAIYDARSNLSA